VRGKGRLLLDSALTLQCWRVLLAKRSKARVRVLFGLNKILKENIAQLVAVPELYGAFQRRD
jgi:hypothetical protein